MDMPYRMYHTLYKSAWAESVAKAMEAEESAKEAAKAEMARNKGRAKTSREAISAIRNINSDDLEELAEDTGLT